MIPGLELHIHDSLGGCPASHLVAEYDREIISSGFTQASNGFQHTDLNTWAIVAEHFGKVVGFMSIVPYEAVDALWISAAYVITGYRRKGVHSAMFDFAIQQAKNEGLSSVQSAVHVNNGASLAAQENQGRKVFGLMMTYPVDGDELRLNERPALSSREGQIVKMADELLKCANFFRDSKPYYRMKKAHVWATRQWEAVNGKAV